MSALEVVIFGLQNMRVSRIDGSEYYCGQQVAVSTQQAAAKELAELRVHCMRLKKSVDDAKEIFPYVLKHGTQSPEIQVKIMEWQRENKNT